jgi:2-beta-glucuronyltransferase
VFRKCEELLFAAHVKQIPRVLRQWVEEADTIIVESGFGLAYAEQIKLLNPKASLIVLMSDLLETIGSPSALISSFRAAFPLIDRLVVTSRAMAPRLEHPSMSYTPHGVDPQLWEKTFENPFERKGNLVSVGSMLFDPSFFEIAAPIFPDLQFHVIGGGSKSWAIKKRPNIHIYGEMNYEKTLAYLQHADVGIAPYDRAGVTQYLADTSMKLAQFSCLGIPAVCPFEAASDRPGRFGYTSGSTDSIESAIKMALSAPSVAPQRGMTWSDVVDRILHPDAFPDTQSLILTSP